MTKSVKVKLMIIIGCLLLSALIMSYRYFTDFKQTQIDEQEKKSVSWDSPINQFEFADVESTTSTKDDQSLKSTGGISKIDVNKKAVLQIYYSTQPFINPPNAKEIADKIATYGKEPIVQNFLQDMKAALEADIQNLGTLPSIEDMQKQTNPTQTQKILLKYSKDPAFTKVMQNAMEDPVFATGFINYIQNQPEQESSK